MKLSNIRLEVMQTLEKSMDDLLAKYLKPIEKNWQPSDFLPDATKPGFFDEIKELQELAKEMPYDLWAVLIGDTITEEALPTYEAWLIDVEGVDQEGKNGWSRWIRGWTAEENRHGDLLNKYLYISGRVDMREMEISTQFLLNDGFDMGTGRDPYRNFVYTSFQELATNISHRRVASHAKKTGNTKLAKMCGMIASDEARHANAYSEFVKRIIEIDASEMIVAFEDMMKKKIVMPAHLLRESGQKIGELFDHFSNAAQRIGVYTSQDYIDILDSLLKEWSVGNIKNLNDKAERARDYLMALPARLQRLTERIKVPEKQYAFKWIAVDHKNKIQHIAAHLHGHK
jgi:acyl-[acyl-carrier-protein] desaturase